MAARIVAPCGPDGEGLLADAGQVTQQVLGVFALLVEVEFHVVEARQPQYRQLVVLRKARLDLQLPVDVVRQERQADHLEQQLQVRLAQREEVGGFLADMAAPAQRHLRSPERRLESLFLGIPVPQPDVQHRAQRPGTVGRESPGVEIDLADQIGIEDAHGAARGALRGKVVDIGDFDAVQIELVFRRAAAAHDQVVAIAHGRERHAGVRTYDTRHVTVGAGALLDLPHPDDLQPDGAFGRGAERRRHDRHGFELRGILLHFDFDERRGGRNEVFGRDDGLVPHGRGREAENTRLHPLEAEASQRIGRCAALFLSDGHYGGIGDRPARQAVDHPAADGIGAALCPYRRGEAQRRKSEKKFYPQCRRHDFANV